MRGGGGGSAAEEARRQPPIARKLRGSFGEASARRAKIRFLRQWEVGETRRRRGGERRGVVAWGQEAVEGAARLGGIPFGCSRLPEAACLESLGCFFGKKQAVSLGGSSVSLELCPPPLS